MVLATRPKPAAVVDEAAALRIIEKGGAAPAKAKDRAIRQHPLKMPADLWERLEAARGKATVKLPRNTVILMAIADWLDKQAEA